MAVKQFKNRNEVPEKYKWDLESMLQNKTLQEWVEKYRQMFEQLIKIKDSKYESKTAFLNALKLEDEILKISSILQNWIFNKTSENIVDDQINAFSQEFEYLSYNLNQKMGPELPRIFANQTNIQKWLKEQEFEPYRSTYERIFETKKHQLPKAIQEFRVAEERADIEPEDVFVILTDVEVDFGFAIDSKGKKIKVTRANRMKLLEHKDKKVRKTSYLSYENAFFKYKETLSNLLFQKFKNTVTWSKLEKFDNVIQMLLYDERISEKLLLSLYQTVQDHKNYQRDFYAIWKKAYKVKYKETPTHYDYQMPLVKVKAEWSIEQMQETILQALQPFGQDYINVVKRAFNERWIDYQTIDNKTSGAYSIDDTYSLDKKYILMNNDGSLDAMSTLAHELGHSLHSYFSDKNNHIRESSYKIFVAEVASIFNELMLYDYVLNSSNDDKLKFKIRQHMAETFQLTVFRETKWSHYEYNLYKAIEKGEPVSTYKQIAQIYYDSVKLYSPKVQKYKEKDQLASVTVPHFYYDFYVYKYAIGQLVANIFFQRYKTFGPSVLKDYIDNFLCAGTKFNPLEVLKNNGIDLEDPKTYEAAFDSSYDNLKELKKLAKKIFKFD